jgi:hypothetical protein
VPPVCQQFFKPAAAKIPAPDFYHLRVFAFEVYALVLPFSVFEVLRGAPVLHHEFCGDATLAEGCGR